MDVRALTTKQFGSVLQSFRESAGLTQDQLATESNLSAGGRTTIALLEQGRRLPAANALELICRRLNVPRGIWMPFIDSKVSKRLEFEEVLGELVGRDVNLGGHDSDTIDVAQSNVLALFGSGMSREQLRNSFAAVLVYYGVPRPSDSFFSRYFSSRSFTTLEAFRNAVTEYQKDAIRLYASFAEAYQCMSAASDMDHFLLPLRPRSDEVYRTRSAWSAIDDIPQERLADLGYISASRVQKERDERDYLCKSLLALAEDVEKDGRPTALLRLPARKRRKIDSLLRRFESSLKHDLMSPLFGADADAIRREAERIAPRRDTDLNAMERTQTAGQRNLASYLASDHLDVYVATSMRSDADFVSVNAFVRELFSHEEVSPLKLRYFNPTQSWIEDRVAKGLVEALMLKRSDFTIYMAQKSDTFGKDSEASVALGQGKPVVVYVPKLLVPEVSLDSESLGALGVSDLRLIVKKEASGDDADVDEVTDKPALLAQVVSLRLNSATDAVLKAAVRRHWADFDLYGESERVIDEAARALYRSWLDAVVQGREADMTADMRQHVVSILVATATNFERRATVFREVHPLALQVILSTGVLNGILVARSTESCAALIARLVRNELDLDLEVDENNYKLIERTTRSTIRVISRHKMIANAFSPLYERRS